SDDRPATDGSEPGGGVGAVHTAEPPRHFRPGRDTDRTESPGPAARVSGEGRAGDRGGGAGVAFHEGAAVIDGCSTSVSVLVSRRARADTGVRPYFCRVAFR